MRVLVTIPHYFRRQSAAAGLPEPFYGSETEGLEARRLQVERCLSALAQTFGARQRMMGGTGLVANLGSGLTVDVALVTTGTEHLADQVPRHLFLHCATTVEPRCLGFVCHDLMRDHAAKYDFFVYLEDDIEITDALFFDKLVWFNGLFGNSALLQPNRYEVASDLDVSKLYVDGDTVVPDVPAQFQDIAMRPRLEAEVFGRPVVFKRVSNVHSGCFCVNSAQLARMAASLKFGKPSAEFFGPLETAATLLIMRLFDVYKPALVNAAFLEMRHLGRRFLVATPPGPGGPALDGPVAA